MTGHILRFKEKKQQHKKVQKPKRKTRSQKVTIWQHWGSPFSAWLMTHWPLKTQQVSHQRSWAWWITSPSYLLFVLRINNGFKLFGCIYHDCKAFQYTVKEAVTRWARDGGLQLDIGNTELSHQWKDKSNAGESVFSGLLQVCLSVKPDWIFLVVHGKQWCLAPF